MTALLRGQAVSEITLRITTAADSIPSEWDWVTLLDLGGDEAVEVVGYGTNVGGHHIGFDTRTDLVQQLLPIFYHDEDNDGQVVLYTDCQFTVGDGSVWKVVPMDPDEVDTGTCSECGLEAYDPDCGGVCNCHHTCE